jgi:hypothetical protein
VTQCVYGGRRVIQPRPVCRVGVTGLTGGFCVVLESLFRYVLGKFR